MSYIPCESDKFSSCLIGFLASDLILEFFVFVSGDADNVPESETHEDADVKCVATEHLERWSPSERLLSGVVHNVGHPFHTE